MMWRSNGIHYIYSFNIFRFIGSLRGKHLIVMLTDYTHLSILKHLLVICLHLDRAWNLKKNKEQTRNFGKTILIHNIPKYKICDI